MHSSIFIAALAKQGPNDQPQYSGKLSAVIASSKPVQPTPVNVSFVCDRENSLSGKLVRVCVADFAMRDALAGLQVASRGAAGALALRKAYFRLKAGSFTVQ